ncbi:MAG: hypothetical protein VW274_08890 [Thalassolituus sp.]
MPVATLENRKQVKIAERKTGFNKIAILSKANIASRKARENGSTLVVSGQSPLKTEDVKPFMPAHNKAADQAVDYVTNGLNHISQKFNGVRLYALTEAAVQQSVNKISGVVFQEQAARELVNTLMRNMDAHKTFSEKLTRVRMATLNNDVAVLVDELLDFAKFFNPELWDRLNVVSETVWDKTGFALGKFTTDFHLKWKRLLQDPFVESVMESVAEAAKSLASYRSVQAEFLQKRKAIEQEISKAPALEKIRSELASLYERQAKALAKCNELRTKLSEGKNDPKNAPKVTEKDVESARTQANELDYAIEQAITRYSVAVESVLTADENADVAKLPGIAIQMHVRAVADLFFTCGMFVLNTAAFFTVQNLLVSANQAQGILQKGKEVTKAHEVSGSINQLSETTKGSPAKIAQKVENTVTAQKQAQTALSQMQAPVRIADSHGDESYELIWYCFQTLSEPKFCKLCEREVAIGEMVARPHYCEHKTGGESEYIKTDGNPDVKKWYVCNECFTEVTEKKNRWVQEGKKIVTHDQNCGTH